VEQIGRKSFSTSIMSIFTQTEVVMLEVNIFKMRGNNPDSQACIMSVGVANVAPKSLLP
jgi:hypothetical protein